MIDLILWIFTRRRRFGKNISFSRDVILQIVDLIGKETQHKTRHNQAHRRKYSIMNAGAT